jgi:hypothetical protein
VRKFVPLSLIAVCAASLGGCASLSRETLAEETTFQVLNAIDFMQTTQIARNPTHYYEDGTMSVFTGPHPSERQVVFYSLAIGTVGHLCTTLALNELTEDHGPWPVRSWEAASLAFKFNVVITNHNHGLSFTTNF